MPCGNHVDHNLNAYEMFITVLRIFSQPGVKFQPDKEVSICYRNRERLKCNGVLIISEV